MPKSKVWLQPNNEGLHNSQLQQSCDRLLRGGTYKDLSTIWIVATRGMIPARVVQSWLALMAPMNNKFTRIFVQGHEVGEAYNSGIEQILNHPELSKWKYILTVEEDNCPPPDGFIKLCQAMEEKTDLGHSPDVVQGLYWTKGAEGQPMIYGNPLVMPRNYLPQIPKINTLQECNGLGMGFNLWRTDIFRKVPKPWFKTVQEYKLGQGVSMGTQDLYFFDKAAKEGFRFACDTRVKVGHWDEAGQMMY